MGNLDVPICTIIGNERHNKKDIDSFGYGVNVLECSDTYVGLVHKTQAMIDWFLKKTDYEYLIKMDDDVWISESTMSDILSTNEPYGGFVVHENSKTPYFGGGCYWIRRDVAMKLTNIRTAYNFLPDWPRIVNVAEDLAVGAYMHNMGIKISDTHNKYKVYFGNGTTPEIPSEHDFDIGISKDNKNPAEVIEKLHLNKRK